MENKLPSRQKYWRELDDKGKIERLRGYIQGIDTLRSRLNDLEVSFKNHRHLDNQIVFPANAGSLLQEESRGCGHFDLCKDCRDKVTI